MTLGGRAQTTWDLASVLSAQYVRRVLRVQPDLLRAKLDIQNASQVGKSGLLTL